MGKQLIKKHFPKHHLGNIDAMTMDLNEDMRKLEERLQRRENKTPICGACNGSGKVEGVWFGQPTGKMVKCQVCNGTGRSNIVRLI